MSNRWWSFLRFGPHNHSQEFIWAMMSFWSKIPSGRGLNFIRTFPRTTEDLESQLQSQLWIWRWEVIRNTSFMFEQVSFDISNINIEENKVRSKLSKNRKWPIIQICQKWKGFNLTSTSNYIIKKASNEILLNMKVVDLSLPFPKSPRSSISHVWLRKYDQNMAKCTWRFKWA